MDDQLSLFSRKEMYIMEHSENGSSKKAPTRQPKKINYENMHLIDGMQFTRKHQFPQMQSYTGATDFQTTAYSERMKNSGHNQAVHFFLDDYRFANAVWHRLEKTTFALRKFDYLFTPDFSMWRNLPTSFYNYENVFRTRFVGAYWQLCGFNVIPTVSWGDLDSFAYSFEGLPSESVVAVSGMGNRRNHNSFCRWCNGLRRLEKEKSPIKIIVYGGEVEVSDFHTQLEFIPDYISKHFRDEKK